MGASGYPIPIQDYIQGIPPLFIDPFFPGGVNLGVNTPEGLYPLTGIKDLTFDVSAARGLTILDNAITAAFGQLNATSVNVFGYSQSAVIASMEMKALDPTNTPSSIPLNFTLVGNPSNPNGGLLARFPGLALPSLGLDVFGIATPDNSFKTNIFTIEYDGFGDFPQYPLNVVSDVNAFLGIIELHGHYPFLSGQELTPAPNGTAVELTNTVGPTLTHYYMIPTENLPILSPLRAIPVIGHPLADLLQPDMRVIVNLGYGSTTNGWSPDPPNIATGFGVIPPVPAGQIVSALAAGAQQGIADFARDVAAIRPSDFTALIPAVDTAGLNQVLAGAQHSLSSPQNFVQSLLNANLRVAYTASAVAASAYATALPTTDMLNAVVTAIPAYNIDLFGNGILQALNGDPVNGLINAFGKPVAADVGLAVLLGGFEVRVFEHAASDIVTELKAL
ncbi:MULTISPECIES: PE-PPE domain-containing protein [Mycobacterium]|nr:MULTISPECIES: PE-PPE domain-containing protein [Mycobacterium]